jgi:hypothetical protein
MVEKPVPVEVVAREIDTGAVQGGQDFDGKLTIAALRPVIRRLDLSGNVNSRPDITHEQEAAFRLDVEILREAAVRPWPVELGAKE